MHALVLRCINQHMTDMLSFTVSKHMIEGTKLKIGSRDRDHIIREAVFHPKANT